MVTFHAIVVIYFKKIFMNTIRVSKVFDPYQDQSSVGPDLCLFDLILYVPSTIFQLYRDGSSWVEPVLS